MCACRVQEALDLDVKQFPEYGLRLILTFRPSTNFLVPLDRCIQLARLAFAPNSKLLLCDMPWWQTHIFLTSLYRASVASTCR